MDIEQKNLGINTESISMLENSPSYLFRTLRRFTKPQTMIARIPIVRGLFVAGIVTTATACSSPQVQNIDQPKNQQTQSQLYTEPKKQPTFVPVGGSGSQISDETLRIKQKIDKGQILTPEEEQAVLDFNKNHPPTGMVVTAEGLVTQNKSLVRDETDTGQINIDPKVLELMEKNIKDSGLEGSINSIKIRDLNDPIFKSTSESSSAYGTITTGNGYNNALGFIRMDYNPQKESNVLNIYLANGVISPETAIHEIGHIPDWIRYLRQFPNQLPDKFQQANLFDSEFDHDYHERFKGYMGEIPGSQLVPFTVPYEKTIVMGKSLELGKILWPDLIANFTNPVDGMMPYFIPRDKLLEAINKSEDNFYKDAILWFAQGLEKEEKMGKKRVDGNGFAEETLGRYLMYLYSYNQNKLKNELPNLFDHIEEEMLTTERISGDEMFADIWALRIIDRTKAIEIDPTTVIIQEEMIRLQKSKN